MYFKLYYFTASPMAFAQRTDDFCWAITAEQDEFARVMMERVSAKWPLAVLETLATSGEPLRFSRLLEQVEGISQKVLTQTLRTLEHDGLVTRTVYPQIPPRVEYKLTALGMGLLRQVFPLWRWILEHLQEFEAARYKDKSA